jgi:GTP-binding protein
MIVGANSRENDMEVNVCKLKKLTNMRAAGSEDAIRLTHLASFRLNRRWSTSPMTSCWRLLP